MSTKVKTVTKLNGRVDVPIIKHEQFKSYLKQHFSLDNESAEIIDEIVIKLVTLLTDVKRLTNKKAEYEAKPLCNGSASWPKDNPGYMKCNHGMRQDCPMHGSPKGKQERLRIGIGRDPREIARVETAINDFAIYQSIKRELKDKTYELSRVQDELKKSIGIFAVKKTG